MKLFKFILWGYCFFQITAGVAQIRTDSIKQFPVLEVSSSRLITFSSGNKTEVIDSAVLSRYSTANLADLLASESQVFVKSYGMGSSAVTSFRGAGASHTAVLWNGFNIQNSMLGMLDISLVPANFLNSVQLQYGGMGALWGSGAVGGTIHLNNTAEFNKGLSVGASTSFGSFSDKQQQVSIGISKKKFVSSLKFFNHDAKNNFPFINSAQYGKPLQKQSNAELEQYGLLQENYFQINGRQTLNTRFWYQNNDRNIPPSMTENSSAANQKDGCYRGTAEWQRTGEKLTTLARVAYFDEWLNFKDSTIREDSKSRIKSVIAEVENRFSISKFDLLNIGLNNTYGEASTGDYYKNHFENRTALFANYKIHALKNTLTIVISARQEFIKNKEIPFTESAGFEKKIFKLFILKGNVAKHYRLPTFNDLYWAGVGAKGNPNLKPESGWSEEASLIHQYNFKKWDWFIGTTVFTRTIDNWIIWLPDRYNSWSPNNVLQVMSRGIEYKLSINYKTGKFKIQLSGMYNYILSTNQKSTTMNDAAVGKQLIYVPIQNAQGSFSVSYKGTALTYVQMYTGYRYTTSDNTHYLKPYSVGNIYASQLLKFKNNKVKVFIQLNNIWQTTYQVMEYRAMPLFNYQLGASFYFNQPK